MATVETADMKQAEVIHNPYSNLEAVFGRYTRLIEQTLQSKPTDVETVIFEKEYHVRALQEWDEKKSADYEYGNRIIAPAQDFNILASKGLVTPIILQVLNAALPNKRSHCSVIEWTAPKDTLYVPSWMFFDFLLDDAAPKLTLRAYERPFLKGSYLQIQPFLSKSVESEEFKNVQKLLERSLKKYQCLTTGDILRIQHEQTVHVFEVKDVLSAQSLAGVTPFDVVSLVNVDVAVDFLPPKDAPPDTNMTAVSAAVGDADGGEAGDGDEDAKAQGNETGVPETTATADTATAEKQFVGVGQRLNDGGDDGNLKKKSMMQAFGDITAAKIECDETQKTTKIQMILIGNKRETVTVNMSTTVQQIYAHAKLVSGYEKEFQLLAGFPPKTLQEPAATVEECQLSGARITQKALA